MTKRITMYITEAHVSISVTNSTARETSAPAINEAVTAMHPSDWLPLASLCKAILDAIPANYREKDVSENAARKALGESEVAA